MSKASGLKAKRVISCSMIVQLSDHLKRVVFFEVYHGDEKYENTIWFNALSYD